METLECIKTRRSIRSYRSDPVSNDAIKKILEAAIHAPSSGNVQDWEFVIVTDPDIKKNLYEASYNQEFVLQAPMIIVVCSDLRRVENAYGMRGVELYSIQNTAAAIQNLMLAAWDLGIGSCWIGAFNESKVKNILGLPEYVRPMALITLGYPAETPQKPNRWNLERFIHWERW